MVISPYFTHPMKGDVKGKNSLPSPRGKPGRGDYTVARLNPQAAVSPQLAFATEAVRRLHQCEQAGARIGPMQGIWRSRFAALCFRLSANNSGRRVRRNTC